MWLLLNISLSEKIVCRFLSKYQFSEVYPCNSPELGCIYSSSWNHCPAVVLLLISYDGLMLSATTTAVPLCPCLVLQSGTTSLFSPLNYICLQARGCHALHTQAEEEYTLWIATIALGDVDFAKEKSEHQLSGFRCGKQYDFIYMEDISISLNTDQPFRNMSYLNKRSKMQKQKLS